MDLIAPVAIDVASGSTNVRETATKTNALIDRLRKLTLPAVEDILYKQYGDLNVFRCGDEVRLFGVILENVSVVDDFDHLVILLEVSEHDYRQAGVTREQAREIQQTFGTIESEANFWSELDGAILDENDVSRIFDDR